MAINIKSTKGVSSESGINILVIGRSGVGKTPMMATAPNPIVLSVERGLLSLSEMDVPYQETPTMVEFNEMLTFLESSSEARNYETACIDSLSELSQNHITHLLNTMKDGRQAYGQLLIDIIGVAKRIVRLPMDTYTIGKETGVVDESSGLTTYKIMTPGKQLYHMLPFEFDVNLAMRMKDGEDGKPSIPYLQTTPCEQYETRDRSGKLSPIERPNLKNIYNKIKRVKKEQKEVSM